ncbi:Reverse transcriptase domain [Arabidopsis suecica]|uniref:Reverse transcriptase domain n=1 Tax=Arabidopsis suecica TaxID=45249 RepID=A0A8T2CP44_ARASU|nr:Reverse transcriptase domain [Arabidopsis suecica]
MLWKDLQYHHDSPLFQNKAWLICGDFNEILEIDDHSLSLSTPVVPAGMRDFQDLIRHCELTDLSYHGQRYTWCNKRQEGVICKKLDRVLVSKTWIQQYAQSYSVFEPGGCSDHMRCRFYISEGEKRVKRPFKFVNTLTTFSGYHQKLEEQWRTSPSLFHSTSAMHRFSKKLKGLKPHLRKMGKQMYGAISTRTKEAYTKLCDLQAATMNNPSTQAVDEEAKAYEKWKTLSDIEEGFLPKGVNSTILALIPKKKEAKVMKDYRPISCCNVLYKVISKILANRLKIILPKFISPNQSAFIKDRLLIENLLLATEIIKDYHKDSVSPRCAMKIDISKAFDSIQWGFLLKTLQALDFPEQYIRWIQTCVTTASFSVQVNGELAGYFNSERGLRQGCSLSPYLFVVCMNVLSSMIDKAARNKSIGYHPKCKQMQLTHLCFADDLMVFVEGNKKSIEGALSVFEEFAIHSGLKISLEKSTLYMAGVSEAAKEEIMQQFPFENGALPVRYLGLPLLKKRMKAADYLPLIEKIRSHISSWTARSLSFAGRLQLLSSVTFSLTNFWIAAFRLPKACIREIDKLCSAFLWSGPSLNPKKAKVSWSDVCTPKSEGGLGLRSIEEANKVCILKLIWRILSAKGSLWVDWVKRYLIRSGSFWAVKETSTCGSWIWKKLLKYRDAAKKFYRVEVKNGETTSFWYDSWSTFGYLHELLGERGCVDLGIPISSTVREVMEMTRRRKHRQPILNSVEEEVKKQKQSRNELEQDVALWRGKNGCYKRKFISKETWMQIREAKPQMESHKEIWFTYATPRASGGTAIKSVHDKLASNLEDTCRQRLRQNEKLPA